MRWFPKEVCLAFEVKCLEMVSFPSSRNLQSSVCQLDSSSASAAIGFADSAETSGKNSQNKRLFAVVSFAQQQFKVTSEDIIVIQGNWAFDIGDRIIMEKAGVFITFIKSSVTLAVSYHYLAHHVTFSL
ncbi:unnamed protein product [Soboliphyme baturini]|uniref:Large ribosomal subunit protein bL21m n=1 Tax=Soboliphyme baturini TaxID=241478 RepID=A0A183J4N8_9BILA|nr:unnamed protein product [Soboliphyme baturini]